MTAAGSVMESVTAHILPAIRFESRRQDTNMMPMHIKSFDIGCSASAGFSSEASVVIFESSSF